MPFGCSQPLVDAGFRITEIDVRLQYDRTDAARLTDQLRRRQSFPVLASLDQATAFALFGLLEWLARSWLLLLRAHSPASTPFDCPLLQHTYELSFAQGPLPRPPTQKICYFYLYSLLKSRFYFDPADR